MKKIALIAIIALSGASMFFTSCSKKKDWVCKCTVAGMAVGDAPILDKKKGDAEDACKSIENAGNATLSGSTSCSLSEK